MIEEALTRRAREYTFYRLVIQKPDLPGALAEVLAAPVKTQTIHGPVAPIDDEKRRVAIFLHSRLQHPVRVKVVRRRKGRRLKPRLGGLLATQPAEADGVGVPIQSAETDFVAPQRPSGVTSIAGHHPRKTFARTCQNLPALLSNWQAFCQAANDALIKYGKQPGNSQAVWAYRATAVRVWLREQPVVRTLITALGPVAQAALEAIGQDAGPVLFDQNGHLFWCNVRPGHTPSGDPRPFDPEVSKAWVVLLGRPRCPHEGLPEPGLPQPYRDWLKALKEGKSVDVFHAIPNGQFCAEWECFCQLIKDVLDKDIGDHMPSQRWTYGRHFVASFSKVGVVKDLVSKHPDYEKHLVRIVPDLGPAFNLAHHRLTAELKWLNRAIYDALTLEDEAYLATVADDQWRAMCLMIDTILNQPPSQQASVRRYAVRMKLLEDPWVKGQPRRRTAIRSALNGIGGVLKPGDDYRKALDILLPGSPKRTKPWLCDKHIRFLVNLGLVCPEPAPEQDALEEMSS